MVRKKNENKLTIYQTKTGAIELRGDFSNETIWASLNDISHIFGRDKSVISRHIKNIFKDKELTRDSVVAFFATTGPDGKTYQVEHFNLDLILSVGYRVNSIQATQFRQWATKTLRQYIVDGYAINRKRIATNYDRFVEAVENVKRLLPDNGAVDQSSTLELIKAFASTWFSLEAYDESKLPAKGATKKEVKLTAGDLAQAIAELKDDLLIQGQATELFAQERQRESIAGIVGNVMQSFGGQDLYSTIEDKAAHLLYFMVKNHPFTDGNKRSGAFSFVWFLRRARLLNTTKITPEALTALTLLVAESDPQEKEQVMGLIRLLIMK